MSDSKYIAITIGPVFETMMNVSKPAGLWGASYLFSLISKELCGMIESRYPGKIITPHFEFDDESAKIQKTGVGFYHDHIVVREADIDVIAEMIDREKVSVGERIFDALRVMDPSYNKKEVVNYVCGYLQIYGIEIYVPENENVLMHVNSYLDSIELRKQYIPAETENFVRSFLENDVIKNSFLTDGLVNWQLLGRRGNIKSIPDIAGSDAANEQQREFKRYSYYALVQSDGDRMGAIISGFETEAQMKNFSTQCLRYTAEACGLIRRFGGVVVYAGGDDLQFMVPLTYGDKNLMDLIGSITEVFEKVFIKGTAFENAESRPTVSFGAEIIFEKYPLYEALSDSRALLYKAKESGRDALTIRLLKHSGQTAEFTIGRLSQAIKKENGQSIYKDINHLIHQSVDGEILHSVSSHIARFDKILDYAARQYTESGDSTTVNNYFDNFFDNAGQEKWKEILKTIRDIVLHSDQVSAESEIAEETGHSEMVTAINGILRLVNIFGEKGAEDE